MALVEPPSSTEIIHSARQWACIVFRKTIQNPMGKIQMEEVSCQDTLPELQVITTYSPDDPPMAEKSIMFRHAQNPHSALILSSVRNEDYTISYWIQVPILPEHLEAAFPGLQRKYPGLYKQCSILGRNEMAYCEQVDPLYLYFLYQYLKQNKYHKASL